MKITFSRGGEAAGPHDRRGGGIQPLCQPPWPLGWQPRGPTKTRGLAGVGCIAVGCPGEWAQGTCGCKCRLRGRILAPPPSSVLWQGMLPVVPYAIPRASLREQILGGKLRAAWGCSKTGAVHKHQLVSDLPAVALPLAPAAWR